MTLSGQTKRGDMTSGNLDLFKMALGLEDPWKVTRTDFNPEGGRLDLYLDFPRGAAFLVSSRWLRVAESVRRGRCRRTGGTGPRQPRSPPAGYCTVLTGRGRASSPATKRATPSWSTGRSTPARPISNLSLDAVRWGARTGSGPAPRSRPRAAARCGQPGAAGPALDNRRRSDRPVRPADPGLGLDDRGGGWPRHWSRSTTAGTPSSSRPSPN